VHKTMVQQAVALDSTAQAVSNPEQKDLELGKRYESMTTYRVALAAQEPSYHLCISSYGMPDYSVDIPFQVTSSSFHKVLIKPARILFLW